MDEHEERPAAGAPGAAEAAGRDGMTHGARRPVVVLFSLMVALAAGNLLFTAQQVGGLRTQQIASCAFDSDLGTAPVIVVPPATRAGLLGVKIISDARVAWHGLGCPGNLAAPGPGFVKWARYYHLPVS